MFIPSQVIVQHYFHRHRALAGGIASAGISFGALTMSPLMRLSIEHYGMQGGLLITGAMSLQCLVPAMLFFPHPRSRSKKTRSHKSISKEQKDVSASGEHKEGYVIIVDEANKQLMAHSERNLQTPEFQANKLNKDQCTKKPTFCGADNNDSIQRASPNNKQKLRRISKAIGRVLDFSLLKNCGFLLLASASLPCNVGIATYNSYSIQRAIVLGVDPLTASFIFTSLGVASLIARFVTGFVGNLNCVNRTAQYGSTAFLVGVTLIVSTITTSSTAFHIIMGFFCGFFVGMFVQFYPIIHGILLVFFKCNAK